VHGIKEVQPKTTALERQGLIAIDRYQ